MKSFYECSEDSSSSLLMNSTSDVSGGGSREKGLLMTAFFIFGLVNNVIYVIFLSAAEDILIAHPTVRKSSVLLASIIPCLLVKLIAPHFIQVIPYKYSIYLCILLSIVALLMVSLSDLLLIHFGGIIISSFSSGVGETTFLALTSNFLPSTVVSWSSGTGAAGIVGGVYYWLARSIFGMKLSLTLLMALIFPTLMLIAHQFMLKPSYTRPIQVTPNADSPTKSLPTEVGSTRRLYLRERFQLIHSLLYRFIAPLFLVYFAEYTINSSVYFTLYFPLTQTPFGKRSDHYRTYQALYQVGVFLSRTLGRFFPTHSSWSFAILQLAMLCFLSATVIFNIIHSIWIIFILILVEGLLGGAAYVNTFYNIAETADPQHVEFSMAVTGIADSMGITLAALFCLFYQPFLCKYNTICQSL